MTDHSLSIFYSPGIFSVGVSQKNTEFRSGNYMNEIANAFEFKR